MINIEEIKLLVVERLKPLNPERVVIFGSYANGEPNDDSDVDLYVVTNDDFIPKNWKEKSEIYLKVSNRLRDLQRIVPIDLIVHTKAMNRKFVEAGSSFYKHAISKGKVLL